MGLLSRLRGTERPPEVEQAIAELERGLPAGWEFDDFRHQLFGRRPVKLAVCGAGVVAPQGVRHLALASGDDGGVAAVRALADAVAGTAATSPAWAPPPVLPRTDDRYDGHLVDPHTEAEREARDAALALLPPSSAPMNADSESFGELLVWAAVAQLPDGPGIAGVALDRAGAWEALAARLRGELTESPVWYPAR